MTNLKRADVCVELRRKWLMEAAAGPLALSISRGRRKDGTWARKCENVFNIPVGRDRVGGTKNTTGRVFCQQREPGDYRRDMDWNIKLEWWRSGAGWRYTVGSFIPLPPKYPRPLYHYHGRSNKKHTNACPFIWQPSRDFVSIVLH